jgi:HSP20 family protein
MNGSLRIPRDVLAEFERLQQQLDRAFPRSHSPHSIRATSRGEFPAINIGSTADTIEIVAFAPGIDAKSVQLSIDKGLLLLAGERQSNIPENGDSIGVYAQERFSGPFRRVVSLPEDADPGRVNASYRDGFLRVSVGKRESSKPRRIEVQS